LLLNSECFLKLADFGLARSVSALDTAANPVLTDYVATRWYRAPEILLGSTKYTKGVDIWSVGCILGELLGGKPMFPGNSTMNQLDRIIEITGVPTPDDIEAVNSPFASTMLESLPPSTHKRELDDLFPHASADALDLLAKCLTFNPDKRITAAEALAHPYVTQFHDPEQEQDCDRIIKICIDDNIKYSISDYRNQLYHQILEKKKEVRRKQKAAAERRRAKRAARKSKSKRSGSGSGKDKDGSKKRSSSSSGSGTKKRSSSTKKSSSKK
jgi:mitogen-activated protein kinase 15